jgi:pyridoxal 5'-phosphate synthase pdxS subunit
MDGMRHVRALPKEQLVAEAKELGAPVDLVQYVHDEGHLPVVNFCAGGVATPADASLMMQLGADGIFVGSGVFKSDNPAKRAKAIVEATTHFEDASVVAETSRGLGEAMRGLEISAIPERELLSVRGW